MAVQSFLNDIDNAKVQELLDETQQNSTYFTEMTSKVVQSYSTDLDNLMQDLYQAVTMPDKISTQGVERYYAELTNLLYFMSDKIEQLNVYNDMSKAAAKEVYNKAYLSNQVKDTDKKNKTTVAENQAVAEMSSQYESVVSSIYEHAYKTLKMKVDAANEMVSTLKNILKHRIQEEYLSSVSGSMKTDFDKKCDDSF